MDLRTATWHRPLAMAFWAVPFVNAALERSMFFPPKVRQILSQEVSALVFTGGVRLSGSLPSFVSLHVSPQLFRVYGGATLHRALKKCRPQNIILVMLQLLAESDEQPFWSCPK